MNLTWLTRLFRRQRNDGVRTVGVLSGFFFMINFVVGTGFLSIPYAFYDAGVISGAITLIVLSFISWNTANWVVETMARAQALETWKQESLRPIEADNMSTRRPVRVNRPNFQIRIDRKFELAELCEIFFGVWTKYLYIIILVILLLLACWSCTTVAGSAWSTNIPFNFGSLSQCSEDAFKGHLFPTDSGCKNAYRFSVLIYAVIVIPLSLLELADQKYLQILLGLLRFFTVGCIAIYCLSELIAHPQGNSGNSNGTTYNYGHELFKFNYAGWLLSIPLLTYGQILHMGIPSLTQPIRSKKWLRGFFAAVFTCTTLLYVSLGLLVSLWFKSAVQETCTLNFAHPAHHSRSTALRVMSYYIIIFPSLDVSSAFPLLIVTVANNLYIIIMGVDSTQANKRRYGRLVNIALRVICAIIPIFAALFITNLVFIVSYGGLLGLSMCYLFPIALQLKSQFRCYVVFGDANQQDNDSNYPAVASEDRQQPVLFGNANQQDDDSNSPSIASEDEQQPLLLRQARRKDQVVKSPWWWNPAYSTPYATVLSHPISVMIFAVLSCVACGLAVAGLIESN